MTCLILSHCAYANTGRDINDDAARSTSSYWQKFAVHPEESNEILLAHQIYDRLLITWDSGKVPPQLLIIDSPTGPWAASLTDGTVLLSLAALNLSLKHNQQNAEDRLAFVLAHELAHQRNQDWWNRRFFSSDNDEAHNNYILDNTTTQRYLAKDELQADLEGLVIMTLSGYEPSAVVSDNSFFDAWIETIWGHGCDSEKTEKTKLRACSEAKSRTQHIKTRIKQLADATLLFELGTQAYIIGNFHLSLDYFMEFGRLFPSRAVHTNIGLNYLGEAQGIKAEITAIDGDKPRFPFLPLVLGDVEISSPVSHHKERRVRGMLLDTNKRTAERQRLLKRLEKTSIQAIKAFERALQLAPSNPIGYIHLASAYLVAGNPPMARGLIEGQYHTQFGIDRTSRLMLSLISMNEGNINLAKEIMKTEVNNTLELDRGPLSHQLILYTATYNLSLLSGFEGDLNQGLSYWQQLADRSKQNGDAIVFRMSLAHIGSVPLRYSPSPSYEKKTKNIKNEISIIGDSQLLIYQQVVYFNDIKLIGRHYSNGEHVVVNEKGREIASWVSSSSDSLNSSFKFLNESSYRVINHFGIPSRIVSTQRGTYWSYDDSGVAFLIIDEKIYGWFLYPDETVNSH